MSLGSEEPVIKNPSLPESETVIPPGSHAKTSRTFWSTKSNGGMEADLKDDKHYFQSPVRKYGLCISAGKGGCCSPAPRREILCHPEGSGEFGDSKVLKHIHPDVPIPRSQGPILSILEHGIQHRILAVISVEFAFSVFTVEY